MSDNLDQPFYVGHQNLKKFPYARYGYLPALEPKEEVEPVEGEEPPVLEHRYLYHHFHSDLSRKQAHSIENNTNQILALKKILNTLLGKRRQNNKYKKYIS